MTALYTSLIIVLVLHNTLCRPIDNPALVQASIQALPPGVAFYSADGKNKNNFININPFLTNSLLQAIVEESEQKKRVQRYRDVKK